MHRFHSFTTGDVLNGHNLKIVFKKMDQKNEGESHIWRVVWLILVETRVAGYLTLRADMNSSTLPPSKKPYNKGPIPRRENSSKIYHIIIIKDFNNKPSKKAIIACILTRKRTVTNTYFVFVFSIEKCFSAYTIVSY